MDQMPGDLAAMGADFDQTQEQLKAIDERITKL
jgi:hypothetical protein